MYVYIYILTWTNTEAKGSGLFSRFIHWFKDNFLSLVTCQTLFWFTPTSWASDWKPRWVGISGMFLWVWDAHLPAGSALQPPEEQVHWNPCVEAPCLLQRARQSRLDSRGPLPGQGLGTSHESFLSPPRALGHLLSSVSSTRFIKSPPINRARGKEHVPCWRLCKRVTSGSLVKTAGVGQIPCR